MGSIPRLVDGLTGFPCGRVLDVGCGPDFTIVCTAPWTGIGPMQIKELEDCAVRVIQSLSKKFLSKLRQIKRMKAEHTKVWHLKRKKYFYQNDITKKKYWTRPISFGGDDVDVKIIHGTQRIPSIQGHAKDTLQRGPNNRVTKGKKVLLQLLLLTTIILQLLLLLLPLLLLPLELRMPIIMMVPLLTMIPLLLMVTPPLPLLLQRQHSFVWYFY